MDPDKFSICLFFDSLLLLFSDQIIYATVHTYLDTCLVSLWVKMTCEMTLFFAMFLDFLKKWLENDELRTKNLKQLLENHLYANFHDPRT